MKRIINIVLIVAAAVLTMNLAACKEVNDWEVDKGYERLFRPVDLTISSQITEAELTWKIIPGAENYVIEISTDSLYNDNFHDNSKRYGEDGSIVKPPFEADGLDNSTIYYARIMAVSKIEGKSKWGYPLRDYTFVTKSEQLITNVAVTATSITIDWTAPNTVTHLDIVKTGEETATKQVLTPAEITAGSATVSGLDPDTGYSVYLMNGEVIRGVAKEKTALDYPYQTVVKMVEGDDINVILAGIAGPDAEVVIELEAGKTFNFTKDASATEVSIGANIKSVIFWGELGGERPTINMVDTSIKTDGAKDLVKFYNLNVVSTTNQYFLNAQDKVTTFNNIEIEQCSFDGLKTIVRTKGADVRVKNISITNCQINNVKDAILGLHEAKFMELETVTISNSTIVSGGGRTVRADVMNTLFTIQNCTYYNVSPAYRLIDTVNDDANTVIKIEKTILAYMSGVGTFKLCKGNNVQTVTDSYITNDFTSDSTVSQVTIYGGDADALFTDPANGDFTIKDPVFDPTIGDPRWKK